jgi:hypothetical protein
MSGPRYSAATKEWFFDLLDRGGTIRAAAQVAGVHEQAAYSWVRAAGLTTGRKSPRIYTAEEKAEFFRRLEDNPNVSAVSRELGFTRVTCYKWAHQAGIFTSEARRVNPRRERFLQLRADGMTRTEAATAVRADPRSAADWDRGITIIHRGRVYPDGRVVRYPDPKQPDVTTTSRSAPRSTSPGSSRSSIPATSASSSERSYATCTGPACRSDRSRPRWVVRRRRSAGSCAAHDLGARLPAPDRAPALGSAPAPGPHPEADRVRAAPRLRAREAAPAVVA